MSVLSENIQVWPRAWPEGVLQSMWDLVLLARLGGLLCCRSPPDGARLMAWTVPATSPGQPGEQVPPELLANGNAGIVFP